MTFCEQPHLADRISYAAQEKVDKIPLCQSSDDIKSQSQILFLITLDMKLKSNTNSA